MKGLPICDFRLFPIEDFRLTDLPFKSIDASLFSNGIANRQSEIGKREVRKWKDYRRT